VFGFKDGRQATFDTFAMDIEGTNPGNIKTFDLLSGKGSPTGHFDPIGTFETQNLKIFATPFQPFRFKPVTARYLKVVPRSNFGYGPAAYFISEFQLFGTLR